MRLPARVADLRAFRRAPLTFLPEVARTRGDVAPLALGPYRGLLVSHPEVVQAVLAQHARSVRKSPVLRAARVVLGDGLLTSEGEQHRRQRRLVQPAFSPRRLDGYAPRIVEATETVMRGWRADAVVDAHGAMLDLTIDVAARTLFGTALGHRSKVVEQAVDDLLAAYGSPLLPVARAAQWLPLRSFRRLRRGRAALDRLVADVIAAQGGGGDHLLAALAVAEMPRRQLRDEVVTLLLAGHETTASMLAWTWWLLGGHPDARAAIEAEVDALDGPLDRPAVDKLPVTRGALAEALRLYPPSWAMGRQATEDFDLDDVRVRRGTVLIASQWVVHRDARWWPEPERFDPWRWTGEPAGRPRAAYFPFGAGPRMCVGEQFAWTEGALAVAAVARRWRLARVPGRDAVPDPQITLRPRGGVWLRLEARAGAGR